MITLGRETYFKPSEGACVCSLFFPLEIRKEVAAAVQSLKKGKSAKVDNVPAELVQVGGEDVINAVMTICDKIWQTGEWPTPWTPFLVIALPNTNPIVSHNTSQERQPAAVPELPNDQPH